VARRTPTIALALLLLTLAAPAQAAVSRGWTTASSMSTARWLHAAARLDDGRVLVTGGTTTNDAGGATRAAELFDPATATWTPAAAMGTPRLGHVLVKLADGRVLAAGGASGPNVSLNTSEIYDPSRNTWTPVPDAMSSNRYVASAVLLGDGTVLITGGSTGPSAVTATAERFLPQYDVWTDAGSFTGARYFPLLAPLPGGRVLMAGGDAGGPVTSSSIYGSGGWTDAGTMSAGRYGLGLNTLRNGTVLASGGAEASLPPLASTEIHDGSGWSAGPSMAAARVHHTATTLADGDVLVAGGFGPGTIAVGATERYDAAAGAWTPAGRLTVARAYPTATLLADGRVLVVGGSTASSGVATAAAELWTPTTSVTHDPSLAFGDVGTGAAASLPVQLTNTGDQPLLTADAAVSGVHAGDFAVDAQRCRVVAPGATCTLDVRFAPAATGARVGTLTLSANTAAGTHAIPLAGRGVLAGSVADADGDGVFDTADRCRTVRGPASRAGCPTGLLADPSIRYTRSGKGIRVLAYYVKATTGARVVVKCSKGCKRTTTKGRGSRRVRITRLDGRRLSHGSKITITVSKPGRLTTTVTDRISRGRRIEGRPRCAPVGC
jgi:hypothetical protein